MEGGWRVRHGGRVEGEAWKKEVEVRVKMSTRLIVRRAPQPIKLWALYTHTLMHSS